jgi:uncharacterized NAD(P)/FAD-binding protein YdhS
VIEDQTISLIAGSGDLSKKPLIAIIGGGLSGAGVAFRLATELEGHLPDIVVFEPRHEIGRGVAYDTDDPAHRINVPAAKMSLLPDQPEHFLDWIARHDAVADDAEARRPDGHIFPRRRLFGEYVAATVLPLIERGAIVHRQASVTAVGRDGQGWRITDSDGGETRADFIVIATSHPSPAAPRQLTSGLTGHPRFIADSTRANSLTVVRPADRVLIVGNGLTSADIIASLTRSGHHGPITAISRRGLRSRGHSPFPQEPFGDFVTDAAVSAVQLLKHVRNAIRQAITAGFTWHAVIDQVRGQGQDIWRKLPVAERRRIIRHLRPYWDVHRFRIAPQLEEVLDSAVAAGRLDILAASVADIHVDGQNIHAHLRHRNGRQIERVFDAVVVTTGPAHGGILHSQKWLKDLSDSGYLQLDPTGLGIACTENSEAIGAGMTGDPTLLIAGPLARGTFGELMGLPQVTEYAVFVANRLIEKLAADRKTE